MSFVTAFICFYEGGFGLVGVYRCDDVSQIYRSESNSNRALISGLPERSLQHNIGACPDRAKALRHCLRQVVVSCAPSAFLSVFRSVDRTFTRRFSWTLQYGLIYYIFISIDPFALDLGSSLCQFIRKSEKSSRWTGCHGLTQTKLRG